MSLWNIRHCAIPLAARTDEKAVLLVLLQQAIRYIFKPCHDGRFAQNRHCDVTIAWPGNTHNSKTTR